MEEYIIGYDLDSTMSQITWKRLGERRDKQETYAVPFLLCKKYHVNQWSFGETARTDKIAGRGTVPEHLLEKALKGEKILLEGESYEGTELVLLFIKKTLELLWQKIRKEQAVAFMFTVERLDKDMVKLLNKIVFEIGKIGKDVYYQSYQESFYQYVIHQPQEIWVKDVLALEYNAPYLKTYLLKLNKGTTPIVAFIENKEFPHMDLSTSKLEGWEEREDLRFYEFMEGMLKGSFISSIYLMGDGFQGNWMKKTLDLICHRRRVFMGKNLYAIGASMALEEKLRPDELVDKYVFLGKDRLKANVGMNINIRGEESYYPLVDGGQNWYETKREWELIMEEGEAVSLTITPLNGKEVRNVNIILRGLPKRPKKATRIKMHLSFETEQKMIIQIEDLGFGEMYPSSSMRWMEEIEI